MILPE